VTNGAQSLTASPSPSHSFPPTPPNQSTTSLAALLREWAGGWAHKRKIRAKYATRVKLVENKGRITDIRTYYFGCRGDVDILCPTCSLLNRAGKPVFEDCEADVDVDVDNVATSRQCDDQTATSHKTTKLRLLLSSCHRRRRRRRRCCRRRIAALVRWYVGTLHYVAVSRSAFLSPLPLSKFASN